MRGVEVALPLFFGSTGVFCVFVVVRLVAFSVSCSRVGADEVEWVRLVR